MKSIKRLSLCSSSSFSLGKHMAFRIKVTIIIKNIVSSLGKILYTSNAILLFFLVLGEECFLIDLGKKLYHLQHKFTTYFSSQCFKWKSGTLLPAMSGYCNYGP